jgi:hypothetical protein
MASFELTTGHAKFSRDRHMLCEVYSNQNKLTWTCILAKLYEHEQNLDAGRFVNFSRTPQAHLVQLDFSNEKEPWWIAMATKINWIAEVTDEPWSLQPELQSVLHGSFTFGFADLGTAMMFKLVFG